MYFAGDHGAPGSFSLRDYILTTAFAEFEAEVTATYGSSGFVLAWSMTAGNDTILGSVTLPVDAVHLNTNAVFDGRSPPYKNTANVIVDPGNTLTLLGTIINTGSITLNGAMDASTFVLTPSTLHISGDVSLRGGGLVALHDNNVSDYYWDTPVSEAYNIIEGAGPGAVLRNVDNTISGTGRIGGNGLTLANQKNGVIEASGHGLVIDTGANLMINDGLIRQTTLSLLEIKGSVRNNGTIVGSAGTILLHDVGGTGGTIEADGTSTVAITGIVNTAGGLLKSVGPDAWITLGGGTLTGALTIASGTQILVWNSGTFDGRAPAFRNTAAVTVSGDLTLRGTIINTGSITLEEISVEGYPFEFEQAVTGQHGYVFVVADAPRGAVFGESRLLIDGTVALQGGGTVTLVNNGDPFSGSNSNHTIAGTGNASVLRNVDDMISGAGTIGGGGLTVVNLQNGIIAANVAYDWLSISADTTVFNGGLLEATGGGRLDIEGVICGSGGTIRADSDSIVRLGGLVNTAGVLASTGTGWIILAGTLTGAVSIVSGTQIEVSDWGVFDGSAKAFRNTATVTLDGNSLLTLRGTIINTGSITTEGGYQVFNINGTNHITFFPSALMIDGNVLLQGGGTITLSNNFDSYDNIYHSGANGILGLSTGAVLRNADNTIQGNGLIGTPDFPFMLMNQKNGVIDATAGSPSEALTIDTGATAVSNAGLMEATGGGSLDIKSAINSSGIVEALGAGSTVHLASSFANTGGLIADGGSIVADSTVSGGGKATITNNGSIEFGGATLEHVSFAGAGKLLLDAAASFHGDVTGFAANDTIGFGDISFGAGTTLAFISNMAGDGGLLRVGDGIHNAALTLSGSYTTASFAKQNDNGHLDVTLAAAV